MIRPVPMPNSELPLIGAVFLGVGALSYAGQFNIMAVADRGAFDDIENFAAGAREELRALAVSVGIKSGGDAFTPPEAAEMIGAANRKQ